MLSWPKPTHRQDSNPGLWRERPICCTSINIILEQNKNLCCNVHATGAESVMGHGTTQKIIKLINLQNIIKRALEACFVSHRSTFVAKSSAKENVGGCSFHDIPGKHWEMITALVYWNDCCLLIIIRSAFKQSSVETLASGSFLWWSPDWLQG